MHNISEGEVNNRALHMWFRGRQAYVLWIHNIKRRLRKLNTRRAREAKESE